jgi:hypothetical protein
MAWFNFEGKADMSSQNVGDKLWTDVMQYPSRAKTQLYHGNSRKPHIHLDISREFITEPEKNIILRQNISFLVKIRNANHYATISGL